MPGKGRSPAQIDADVARLQEGIRRAREAVRSAGRSRDDAESYEQAVAEVARATRALVDYEARITQYEADFRLHVEARTYRRAGGVLALTCMALCLAVFFGAVSMWWLVLLGPLLLAPLRAVPGAGQRAADPRFRPRAGAVTFLLAGLITVLCVLGALTAWFAPIPLVIAWTGLYVFGALTAGRSRVRAGVER